MRVWFCNLAIGLGSTAFLTFAVCPPALGAGEPSYKGKPLSSWLEDLRLCKTEKQFVVASNAVHRIGTNALPYLVRILHGQLSPSEEPMPPKEAAWKYFLHSHAVTDESDLRLSLACRVLGSLADPIITELKSTVGNPNGPTFLAPSRRGLPPWDRALGILLNMHAEGMLPLMQGLLQCGKVAPGYEVDMTTSIQNLIAQDPAGTLPMVVSILQQPNQELRLFAEQMTRRAFEELSGITTDAVDVNRFLPGFSQIVRALSEDAQPESVSARAALLNYLGTCGKNASRAVPLVSKALADPSESVRIAATNALHRIDPQTAAKHGIK